MSKRQRSKKQRGIPSQLRRRTPLRMIRQAIRALQRSKAIHP